jgi:hypothetical protein
VAHLAIVWLVTIAYLRDADTGIRREMGQEFGEFNDGLKGVTDDLSVTSDAPGDKT